MALTGSVKPEGCMTSLAYHKGYIAGQQGFGEKANPYPVDTYEYANWSRGNLQYWIEMGDFQAGCI